MNMIEFVHLDVQSAYSFLWGTFTPEQLVAQALQKGFKSVGLADIWSLQGAVRFYKAAKRAGIRPVIGSRIEADRGQLLLIALSRQGYENLCRLISAGLQGRKGPVSMPVLSRYSRGLAAIFLLHESPLGRRHGDENGLEHGAGRLSDLKDIFPGNFYLGLVPAAMERARYICSAIGVPPVALNSAAFLTREDYWLHRLLVDIQRRYHHRRAEPLGDDSFYLAGAGEMARRLPWPEALKNSAAIAEKAQGLSLPLGRLHPPCFQRGLEADRMLARRSIKLLANRFKEASYKHVIQLDKELSCIKAKGLSDFFLLVDDVARFARKRRIIFSPRGSAVGSLVVSLLLDGPDPVAHDLLFERFMNEGRGDMPDVDMDFDSERRDEVLAWVLERFKGQAAMVSTVHHFKVRSAVRLAAIAMGYSQEDIKHLSACLPWSLRGIDLVTALSTLPELKNAPIKAHPRLVEGASRLSGLPFQASVHLGGVIVVPDKIEKWSPVFSSRKGFPVAQLDKDDVEDLGLLKLDLLGLRMHTAIRKAEEALWRQGRWDERLAAVPLDDKKTFWELSQGDSLGVFQLESPGQRQLLGKLRPGCFDDLVAEISLFRPGPVEGDLVRRYVERRAGRASSRPIHDSLANILEETYGVIVFQEQVLKVVHTFAGFSYADADAFRRAMTKKRSVMEMQRLKAAFIQGALQKGHTLDEAQRVFEQVSAFAAYGFCKAHAVAFSHIAYKSAWLKTHHPRAFYIGMLNSGSVGSYPAWVILNEARRKGVRIYPPHVNHSGLEYEPDGNGIRVPLQVIRGIGSKNAHRIVAERLRNGPFTSWESLFKRVQLPRDIKAKLIFAKALSGLPSMDEERIYARAA